MGQKTNIEWCDSTINLSSGCNGCELWNGRKRTCYAGVLQTTRLSRIPQFEHLYSQDFGEVRMIPGRMAQAAAWPDLRGQERPDKPWLNGMPRTIFVGDLGDFLSAQIKAEFLKRELLGAMTSRQGQRHFYFLLTKRPNRLAALSEQWGGLPDNCMAMTTVTDQKTADARVPELLRVRARWRGISAEPLLGRVVLSDTPGPGERAASVEKGSALYIGDEGGADFAWSPRNMLHWVIAGGESGVGCEPMQATWARGLLNECYEAGVPFFFKQWGGVNKKAAGRELDGRYWNGMPRLGAADGTITDPAQRVPTKTGGEA